MPFVSVDDFLRCAEVSLKFYLFISFYFWLNWVFVAVFGLSAVVAHGLLIVVASLLADHGL